MAERLNWGVGRAVWLRISTGPVGDERWKGWLDYRLLSVAGSMGGWLWTEGDDERGDRRVEGCFSERGKARWWCLSHTTVGVGRCGPLAGLGLGIGTRGNNAIV